MDIIINAFELFLLAYVAMYFHLIVHEGGHLICALLSGYEFVSFRIGSFLMKQENNKFIWKKYSIPGTSGQCLMKPPQDSSNYPYKLYNAGGVIMNLLFSALFFLLFRIVKEPSLLNSFFLMAFVMGLYLAIMNGLPLKIGGIANDGHNMLSLSKNPGAKYGFWLQMHVNALLSEGQRLKDMPLEWFETEGPMNLDDPLATGVAVFHYQHYLDNGDYDKAESMIGEILENAPKLISLYRNEIHCDLLFCYVLRRASAEEIDRIYTKELKKYIKATLKYYPSKNRIMYAYELLFHGDPDAALPYKRQLEKSLKSYPYPGEIQSEKELMDMIDGKVSAQHIFQE